MITKNCSTCNLTISVRPERLKDRNYCSRDCSGMSRRLQKPVGCAYCGTTVMKQLSALVGHKKHYCSRECTNRHQVGRFASKYVKTSRKCSICRKPLREIERFRRDKKCCSKACATKAISGQRHHFWRGGVSFETYPREFSKALKYKIKIRDNHTCQGCGAINTLLHIHHIDSNRKNCKEKNLIAVCQRCNNGAKKARNYWQHFYRFNLHKRGLSTYNIRGI